MASLIILVKSKAWSARPIVEKLNGTENNLWKINCTSKYTVMIPIKIKLFILLIILGNILVNKVINKINGKVNINKYTRPLLRVWSVIITLERISKYRIVTT